VLDKASLRLGDNNTVNFERTMIFMTSNLGAVEMMRALRPEFGFEAMAAPEQAASEKTLERIGMHAVRRKFSPEFVNRIDAVVTYRPLTRDSLDLILEQQLAALQAHINNRLGTRAFPIEVSDIAREFLIDRGTSPQYGARELKRLIHRQLIQPISALVANGLVDPGEPLYVDRDDEQQKLVLTTDPVPKSRRPKAA
jgi:ATP-dependent Clp protease ATP-binding subunit ClpA